MREAEIAARLAALGGWQRVGASIRKQYRCPGFPAALAFVNRVGALAESARHHPDILVEYDRVTLTLTTHDAGGLTERDFDLAAQVEQIPT